MEDMMFMEMEEDEEDGREPAHPSCKHLRLFSFREEMEGKEGTNAGEKETSPFIPCSRLLCLQFQSWSLEGGVGKKTPLLYCLQTFRKSLIFLNMFLFWGWLESGPG